MPLDKQEKEEIRAVVASELQDVLRQELAQWWTESVLALSAGRQQAPQEPPQPSGDGYLLQMARALARAHAALADDLQRTMGRLRRAIADIESLVERIG